MFRLKSDVQFTNFSMSIKNKALIIFCVVLLIASHSCSRPIVVVEKQLLDIASLSQQTQKPTAVLLGDYRAIKKWCNSRQFLDKYAPYSDTLFYIDLSLKNNRIFSYVFQFESLPALLFIDSSGSFNRLTYLSEEFPPKDVTFSEEESRYLMTLALISSGRNKEIKYSYRDDFLYNYLMAVSFDEKNDSALFYANKAFETYNEDEYYSALYDDLTLRFLPNGEMVSQGDIITLPNLKVNDSTQVSFKLTNISNTPLVIYSVAVSCSCVSVDYPKRIRGHASESIVVKYVAGDRPGPISQSITLRLNTEQKIHRFKINGFVIK